MRLIGLVCGSYSACHWTPSAKAGASAMLIASIVPCTFGLRTSGGTEGIATSTTAAVVWSFLLILAFDFLIVRLSFALV